VLDAPIFVIGCGRSGTTVLGECIGVHRDVAYLHEPRAMWLKAYPQGDVWSADAVRRNGRIVLDADDWSEEAAANLERDFGSFLKTKRRARLCEKTPINAFRVDLIDRAFPDARYLYIEREPLAVARSIAERCKKGTWWGVQQYKWRQLAALSEEIPQLNGIAGRCVTDLQKALMEWTLSTHFARRALFGGAIPPERALALSYEAFTHDPIAIANAIEKTAGLRHDPAMLVFAEAHMRPARHGEAMPADLVVDALLVAAKSLCAA